MACNQDILDSGSGQSYKPDVLTDYLEQIEGKVRFRHWYFGHYHLDKKVDSKHTLLCHAIISLEVADMDFSKSLRLGHPMYRLGEAVTFKGRDAELNGMV